MKHRHNWKYLTGEKLQLSACECGVTKPMKRIKKECNCHCHNEFHWFINDKDSCAGITECPHCSPKPMKRIKKERTHNIEDTHYACNEQMERLGADTPCCICFGHKCKQLKAIKKECDACKPREHGIVIVEKVEEGGRCIQCRRIVCSTKPTEKNEYKCSKAYGNDCFYCGRDMTKPTKVEIKEIKTNPINEHTDINIVVIVNKLNEVIREINKLLSH